MDDGAWVGAQPAFDKPRREPMFRAPWPALAMAGLLPALYALQTWLPDGRSATAAFGFSPADLAQGRPAGLVTALFVHGGWTHVTLNALAALAFGAPVARRLGAGAGGIVAFFAFYLLCGVVANLGFAVMDRGSDAVLVGASGAVSGLMGAASRLMERGSRPAAFTSPSVVGLAAAWLAVNGLIAGFGLDIGAGGAPVAWQAHLVGYAAGLLLIGPVLRLVRRG